MTSKKAAPKGKGTQRGNPISHRPLKRHRIMIDQLVKEGARISDIMDAALDLYAAFDTQFAAVSKKVVDALISEMDLNDFDDMECPL